MGKPMTAAELIAVKTEVDNLLKNRKGTNKNNNNSNNYAGASYGSLNGKEKAFTNSPSKGTPIRIEHAEKTSGELLDNFYAVGSANCGSKKTALEKTEISTLEIPKANTPINSAKFTIAAIKAEATRIANERLASNGVTEASKAIDGSGNTVEKSSCKNACSGICVGSCIGFCNGCSTQCTGSCTGACSGGCSNCTGSCSNNCSTTCYAECSGEQRATTKY